MVVESKPGLPTDPDDPRAFIDMFTDISGLFVINNEASWYEGWMVRDITIPFPVSIGAFNSLQKSDIHAYWKFNAGTNWVIPHYELPFTGGVPGYFIDGLQYALQSVIPGSGPERITNSSEVFGDDPDNPHDPDRAEAEPGSDQRETRLRYIPSGLTDEVLFNVFFCELNPF